MTEDLEAPASRPTRRELLGLGAALGAGGSLVGAAGSLLGAATAAAAPTPGDAQLLLPILGAELLAVFSFQHVLDSGLLSEDPQRACAHMLGQEHVHVSNLRAQVDQLGLMPPGPLTSVTDADKVLIFHHIPNLLATLHSERDCITLLVRLEALLEGVYYTAIGKLESPVLLQLASETMASEAQHYSLLNELLRPGDVEKAVPNPFVHGAS